jgi:tRNA A58 N-methylase Trm61
LSRFYHRNVLELGFDCEGLETLKADGVFLDLPRPQDAIDHALRVLKNDGRLCSFSPCIEQVVATAKTMTERGFMDIRVVECNERRFVRKKLREGEGQNFRTVFSGGQKEDRTHTGYLLFGTLYQLA